MVTTLRSPKGISSGSVVNIPDNWSAEWFRSFIRTQLGLTDIRNATAGEGIRIDGEATTVATVSVSSDIKALFHQPYALATAPAVGTPLDQYRVIAVQPGVLTATDGGATAALTLAVANNGIGNTQIRQSAATSVVGNAGVAPGNVADISSSSDGQLLRQAAGVLAFGTVKIADTSGLGPSFTTTGLTAGQVLRASGASSAAFAQLSAGDISGQVTLAQLPSIGAQTVLGNITAGSATPTALSETQLTSMILTFSSTLSGAVPASGGGTAAFLRADGNFAVPAYPTAANPSGLISLSAANGSAATFARSDATHALDQGIAPTWTGLHKFSANIQVNDGLVGTPAITFTSEPGLGLYRRSAANMTAAAGGNDCASFTSTQLFAWLPIRTLLDGSTTTPQYSFNNETTIGLYRVGAGIVGVSGKLQVSGNFAANGVTPAAQPTGYGTPTGGAHQVSFAAGSITLPNLAAAVAQLIIELKAYGLLGA